MERVGLGRLPSLVLVASMEMNRILAGLSQSLSQCSVVRRAVLLLRNTK